MRPFTGTRLAVVLLICLAMLVRCNSSPVTQVTPTPGPRVVETTADSLIALAEDSRGLAASGYLIQAAELLVDEQDFDEAAAVVNEISDVAVLDDTLQLRLAMVRAEIELAMERPQQALEWLEAAPEVSDRQDSAALQEQYTLLQVRGLSGVGRYPDAVTRLVAIAPQGQTGQEFQDLVWANLQRLSDRQLNSLASGANSYELRGWIELTRAIRAEQYSMPRQVDAVSRWRGVWNRHSAAELPPLALQRLEQVWNTRPRNIALLLPIQDQIGRAVQEGFLSAYYEALASGEPVPAISVFDTTGVTEVRGLYETAVASGADLIIGPLNKELVRQIDNLSGLSVPTLALNYTDFETRNTARFFQFGLAPEDEIRHMARLARAEGYLNAAIISPNTVDYQRLQQAFTAAWENQGGRVVSIVDFTSEVEFSETVRRLLAIDASESRAERITSLLPRSDVVFTPRRRGDIDFIFLMANPRQGRQIKPTLAFYFAGDLPVFALSAINDGLGNQVNNQDLNGIVFTDTPWVLNQGAELKQRVDESLRTAQGPLQRLRALGVDSFRLYPRLGQLASGELANFRGATGYLSMNRSGIIERVPQTGRFENGQVVPHEVLASN